MIKICFWLNVPSNHQTLFLEALNQNEEIDLQVRYFEKSDPTRLQFGWRDEKSLAMYEKYVQDIDHALKITEDWNERINIIMGYGFGFNRLLLPILIGNKASWVHWSERHGVLLAEKLHYNVTLFKLLRPLFLWTKRSYGALVEKHALGCFSQGLLAKKDFITMGISENKIANLFYTTTPMTKTDEIPGNLKNFDFKYKFIYVGKLCERKGISDLLLAFSTLTDKADWGLVLLGQDTSDGSYQKLASELKIDTKVLFAGVVQESSINQYHSHCDVFILSSRFDGWGAVINEAASMGMPIIGSDQSGASHHLIKNNENGYIFSAGDTKGLANAMQNYVSHPEMINPHGKASLEFYRDFTPEKNVERFINALSIWTKSDPL